MVIQSSNLAGEIIIILENASCSVRINDFETILQASKQDISFAIARLLSEGLIELIKEDERKSVILIKSAEMLKYNYSEKNIAVFLDSAYQA